MLSIAIEKVRKGEIEITPGYDGEFGKVRVFGEGQKEKQILQQTLL